MFQQQQQFAAGDFFFFFITEWLAGLRRYRVVYVYACIHKLGVSG